MTDWTPGTSQPASAWNGCGPGPASDWDGCGPAPSSDWAFAFPPSLVSISPASGIRGRSTTVILDGSAFGPDSTVQVSGGDVHVSAVAILTGRKIRAVFTVDIGAPVGNRSVTVTTSVGISNAIPWAVIIDPTAFTFSTVAGVVTIDGAYTVVTFNADDTFTILTGTRDVQYLLVAGGAAGGGCNGGGVYPGGGGAGGVKGEDANPKVALGLTVGAFPVVVGAAGIGLQDIGTDGGPSSFDGDTALGGGAGGSLNVIPSARGGRPGGSGGGGGSNNPVGGGLGGAGTAGQGNNGASATGGGTDGGGGGGASQPGGIGAIAKGGDGVVSTITGAPVTYGGGGGGGGSSGSFGGIGTTGGIGGAGGGANGRNGGHGNKGTDGLGGGGGATVGNNIGGDGGKGRVILRFLT